MAMALPGGIIVAGELRRDFSFHPATGELELFVGESGFSEQSLVGQVTTVLCQSLQTLGGVRPESDLVRDLSIGDRQYLMMRLAEHIDDRPVWLVVVCNVCNEPFDVSFSYADLPVKPAESEYPCKTVETSVGKLQIRSLTGADQEHIAKTENDIQARQVMLQRIIQGDGSNEINVGALIEADIKEIEEQLEAMSPECTTRLLAKCPNCQLSNHISVNPYAILERSADSLFAEVHTIASHYHWSEHSILALPLKRRQNYLRLIDQGRGMQSFNEGRG